MIEFEGVKYETKAAMAEALGLTYSTFMQALRDGASLEEAVEKGRNARKPFSVEFEGKVYKSYKELAEAYSAEYRTITSRVAKGWPLKCAVYVPPMSKGSRGAVVYKGVLYQSRRELCNALGIPESMVVGRMLNGMSLEQAVELPKIIDRPVTSVIIDGVTYANKQAAYDAYGIPKHVVLNRIRHGMTLEEAITTPYEKKKAYRVDGKEFTALTAVDEYFNVPSGTIGTFMNEGHTFEEACDYARSYVRQWTLSPEEIDQIGCSKAQYNQLRLRVNGDKEQTLLWLTKVFKEYPTEFSAKTYQSVQHACDALGISDVASVRSRMLNLIDFEEAIHQLYYVTMTKVYTRKSDLREALDISRPKYEDLCREIGDVSNDEFVRLMLINTTPTGRASEATSLSIRKSNKGVSGVVNCKNGMFVVYCAECGRPLYLTENDAREFAHSEEYCAKHTHELLYSESVTAEQFREAIRRKGGYAGAIASYANTPNSSVVARIKQRADVQDAKLLYGCAYALITCSVCGRTSLHPVDDAKTFEHSSKCDALEWEYVEPPYKHRIGTPPWWWDVMQE